MIELTQSALLFFATILMVVALGLSFIPILPGPMLVWGVAIIYGYLNQWQRFTPAAGVVATGLMLVGVTSDFWLPVLGMRTSGLTCLGAIGSFIGGIVGTILIPLPICGTLIGVVAGALLVELVRWRDLRRALQAGQSVGKMFVIGYMIEAATSIGVFVVYVVSLLSTG